MATKKKKTAKRKPAAKGALARIEAELPKTLRGYVREVEKYLNHLEKDIEKAGATARKRSAKLLRDASRQLGAVEQKGEANLRRYRSEAAKLIHKLEKNVAPPKRAKKKATKKKATKKAAKRKTTKKKAAKKKTTKKR